MSGVELTTAYVQLLPSLRDFGRSLQRQMGPVATRAGREFGDQFGSGASGAVDAESLTGDATSSAGKLGGKFGKLFGAGAALAIGAAILGAVKEAADQEVAVDKMTAALGANAQESKRLGGIAGDLYSQAYGDSLGSVTEALENVRASFRELGTGKELEDMTRRSLDFSNIFGIDLPRAVQVAKTAVTSGFAKDSTQALDLFTAGLQKVAPSLRENVLDAVDEYGQFFNTLGVDGPNAMAMLVKAAQKGEFGIDKVGDAIKEFTIRSTDMSASSKSAYALIGLDAQQMADSVLKGGDAAASATQKIVDGLLSLKPGAEQANAAIALFGTPIEDLNVKDIPQFLQSLKAGEEGLTGFKGAIDKAGNTANDNASTNIEQLKRTITQTFVEVLGGQVIPWVTKATAALNKQLGPAFQWIRDRAREMTPMVLEFGRFLRDEVAPVVLETGNAIGDKLKPVLTQLGQTFQSDILPTLKKVQPQLQAIAKFVLKAYGSWLKFWAMLAGKVLPITIKLYGAYFKRMIPAIVTFGSVLVAAVKKVAGFIGALIRTAKRIGQFASALIGGASRAVSGVVSAVASLPGKVRGYIDKMKQAGAAFIGGLFAGIRSAASGAGGVVAGIASAAAGAFRSMINGLIDEMNRAIPDKLGWGKFAINLPSSPIPHLAVGTNFHRGGTALVGEEGPELVVLPRGAQVKTASETRRMARTLTAPIPPSGTGAGRYALTITNWRDGTGYIAAIADGRVSSAADLAAERKRAAWASR